MEKNLNLQLKYQRLVRRDDAFCNMNEATAKPPIVSGSSWAWSSINDPNAGTKLCKKWFSSCPECQRDVLTHEFFHQLGLVHMLEVTGKKDRFFLTPDESLNDANEMAQLVSYIATGLTDACWKFEHGKGCGQPIS